MGKRNWRSVQHFPHEWSNRTRLAANLIENTWSVIEFGAGNGYMGNILGTVHKYLPTDLIKRRDEFEIVNLDLPLKLSGTFDAGVAMGVLEYVSDVRFTLKEVSNSVPNLITTYCCARYRFSRFKPLRKYIGWNNHLTATEFEERMDEAGFVIVYKEIIEKRFFYRQYLYKLKSRNA